MTSTERNRVSEKSTFKCPTCNAVHILKTVVIGDHTFRVNDAREVFGVTTECPVCLDECSGFMVSPCGHILCKDDYQKMGGVMRTSYDSANPRRAVRLPSRSVDPPSMDSLRTQNGATAHQNRPVRLDVTTTTLSSTLAVRDAYDFGFTASPTAPHVNSTESEVARSVTNLPMTMACAFLSILIILIISLPLSFELPLPMAFIFVLIILCVGIAIDIVDDPELRQILEQILNPVFITCIYRGWLVFIIGRIVGMRLDILVELKIIWAFGTLSILLTFIGIFVRGKSLMESLLLIFGIGLSHFFIFVEVKHLNY